MKYVFAPVSLFCLFQDLDGWVGGGVHKNKLSLSKGYAIEFNMHWNPYRNTLTLSFFLCLDHTH